MFGNRDLPVLQKKKVIPTFDTRFDHSSHPVVRYLLIKLNESLNKQVFGSRNEGYSGIIKRRQPLLIILFIGHPGRRKDYA